MQTDSVLPLRLRVFSAPLQIYRAVLREDHQSKINALEGLLSSISVWDDEAIGKVAQLYVFMLCTSQFSKLTRLIAASSHLDGSSRMAASLTIRAHVLSKIAA